MKKTLLLFAVVTLLVCAVNAQSKKDTLNSKNIVKINLSSLALNNYSFQYERKIGSRVSLALGFRYMPESAIPFKSKIIDFVDDADTEKQLNNFKTGNYAITPELRWYISRKGAPRGFYIAPYARYAKYTASVPFEFEVPTGTTPKKMTIDLAGDVTALTGGVLLGSQWRLSKLVYLDLWLLGPNYGTSNGNIDGTPKTTLSDMERDELRKALNDLEIPLTDKEVTVTKTSANIKLSGPWAGIRGLGFNLGFRF